MKKVILLFCFCIFCWAVQAQYSSIATDVSILRSYSKGQKFWAFGQTVQGLYHINEKWSAYASIGYYTAGKFKNNFIALSKGGATPQRIDYTVNSSLRFRQVSLGFRHYLKGSYNNEESWSLYALGGFGILLIKAENNFSPAIDTAAYFIQSRPQPGSGKQNRLTFDAGLGAETALGASIYLYGDIRTWLQASDYPSSYIFNNKVPRVFSINAGLRILFD